MKAPTYVLIIVMVLAPLCCFSAEDAKPEEAKEENGKFEVEAGLIGTYPSISGNEAKFNEYGDMQDGVVGAYGNIFLRYDNQKGYFLDFTALDIGYETQSYRLDGNKSGDFQYFFFYKEIPHNITWNALTPYSNPGSDNLVYGGSISTWMPFDYSTLRKNYGGGISVERL
ncbi:MAG: putative outer rane beta-barrel porin, MtrB/PioB, partial [Deltaproteobacteria bacterium]|nr:putative outer rane beta-barrel porin, MtrB/PioB [Deltaproteobacteria bacterium]